MKITVTKPARVLALIFSTTVPQGGSGATQITKPASVHPIEDEAEFHEARGEDAAKVKLELPPDEVPVERVSRGVGSAKSRIVAAGETKPVPKKTAAVKRQKVVKQSRPIASAASKSAMPDSATDVPVVVLPAPVTSSPTGAESQPTTVVLPAASSSVGTQEGLDPHVPDISGEVTNGVKVEDIIEQGEAYRFAGLEKPDPFVAPVTIEETKKIETVDAEEIPIISPLQYYDVKSLTVTGVWEGDRGKWKALIETPDRQGIIAKVQDSVGNSGGRVTEITTNGVLVREYKLRKDGSQEFSDRIIPMAKEADSGDKFVGGKIILIPGATTPQVQKPDTSEASPNGLSPTRPGLHAPTLEELQRLGNNYQPQNAGQQFGPPMHPTVVMPPNMPESFPMPQSMSMPVPVPNGGPL